MTTYIGHAAPKTLEGYECTKCHRFYQGESAEHVANYCCAEKAICDDCGQEFKKDHWCKTCHQKKQRAKYDKFKVVEWDGKAPLATWDDDKFFFDVDSLHDYIDECDCSIDDLMLVMCTPDMGPTVDADIFTDHMPEDWDEPKGWDEIREAMANLNKVIHSHGPHCWWADNVRPSVESVKRGTTYTKQEASQ